MFNFVSIIVYFINQGAFLGAGRVNFAHHLLAALSKI